MLPCVLFLNVISSNVRFELLAVIPPMAESSMEVALNEADVLVKCRRELSHTQTLSSAAF